MGWMRWMEKVSCSVSPSQSLDLIFVAVDRESGARSQQRALLGAQAAVGHHLGDGTVSSCMGLRSTGHVEDCWL